MLSSDDVCLFNHPNVERLRIAYVALEDFGIGRGNFFRHEKLTTLVLESHNYSQELFKRLIISSKNMTIISIYHDLSLPWSSQDYLPLLAHAADTLKVLKLKWINIWTEDERGMDLRNFKTLRKLVIDPSFLLGSYTTKTDDFPQRLARNLPLNIKVLVLEGLVSPYPPPAPNLVETLPKKHARLVRTLIEQKEVLAPSLRFIDMDCVKGNSEFPNELHNLAEEHGVSLGVLLDPDMHEYDRWIGWLDEP